MKDYGRVVKNKISYKKGQFMLNLEYFKFPGKQNIQKLKADVLKLMLWKSPSRLNPVLGNVAYPQNFICPFFCSVNFDNYTAPRANIDIITMS